MIKKLKIKKTIEINADTSQVWDALTNPKKIKQYLFGTETISDWKVGSTIIFQGEYQGQKYKDKGKILDIKEGQLLQYAYWSGFSGLEDKEENYSKVTYKLNRKEPYTILTLTQEGFASKQAREHSENNWGMVLDKIKEIIEK